jgi:RNA polymerase sigma-70 factor (ECF subfamily)
MRAPVAELLPEDQELVERARQRDMAAFEKLVLRYRSKIYGLALRMMKDAGEAEELMQETFLSAWQNLPRFRGESAFSSWLYRICANFALMRLRRRKFEAPPQAEEQLPEPRFDSEGTLLATPSYDWSRGTEEKALDRELRNAIETATSKLPVDYRTVFLLKDVEGLSYEEIAEATESSVPAVKSRLHRARLALRESIESFYAAPRPRAQAAGGGTPL